ncbi:hypothetical protein [Pseudomonas mandelii]
MRRFYPTFSQHQTDQLLALNRHLAQLEYSCLQRARHLVEHYKELIGGIVDWEQDQDFELESSIWYYRPLTLVEEQDESESHDGLVLQTDFIAMPPLKWYYLNPTAEQATYIFERLYFNWNDGVEGIDGLKNERICWSFHDLHDHHRLTWEQILQIDSIALDIHAVHQIFTTLAGCQALAK